MFGVIGGGRGVFVGLHVMAVEGEVVLISWYKMHLLLSLHEPLIIVSLISFKLVT